MNTLKKILIVTLFVLMIPYFVVNLFIRDDEIKFHYTSNMKVRVKRESIGKIEEVPFEQYITGVLAGEMPVSFSLEALKAQAVAARSYVMKKMAQNQKNDYDIVDTVSNQVYLDDEYLKKIWGKDYVSKINKIKEAVQQTNGEYLAYDGKVIEAFFFSTSVGETENSEEVFVQKLPYLRSVKSEWDKKVSPIYEDQKTFTLSDFYKKLNLSYQNTLTTKILKTTSTGRVKTISINNQVMDANTVTAKLGLRSTYFRIEQKKNQVIVNTKGFGHGVGLSQYGAEGMAQDGYQYDEILKYYYQGVEIKKI